MSRRWGIAVLFVFSFFVGLFPASAQQFSGVGGVVTDSSGSVVADAQVVLDNASLGVHLETTTNDQGFYQILKLAPASGYQLTFTKDGFRKVILSDLGFGVSRTETHNVTLEVGDVAQTLEVKAAPEATLNTTDATVGNVIDAKAVAELPVQFRLNPATLMSLQAGVNDTGAITGARTDQGNITLDGMDVNDQATGQAFSATVPVSIDALQEVRTVTAGETADYGRSSGGMVSLVTKGGTNNWHGNLREYNRNTLSAANDWFNNRDGVARPALIRNQFGGNIGGPIQKDKLFFFFDYEGLRRASSSNVERSVPTPAFLAGQIGYINDNAGCDGTARLNTAPNCISFLTPTQSANIDPQGVGPNADLLSFMAGRYPSPNDPTGGDGINSEGFRFTSPAHDTVNVYTARVDYNLNDRHKIFLRGSFGKETVDDNFNTSIVQFPGDPAPNSKDKFSNYTTSIGWTWTVSPTMINQLSAGLTRSLLDFPSLAAPPYPDEFTFGGPFSDPYLASSAQARNVPIPELRDGMTWTKGNHTIDFGTDIKIIRQISALKNDFNFVSIGLGGLNQSLDTDNTDFLRPHTSNGAPADINEDLSAINAWDTTFPFMLGRYASVFSNFNYDKSGTPFANGTGKRRDYNYNEFEFYVQDQWKIRPDLTLTFGLRYDLHTVPYEVNGFESVPNVDESTYLSTRINNAAQGIGGASSLPLVSYSLGGAGNSGAPGYYDSDHKDFGPRFAVAYNPSFRDGLLGQVLGDRRTTIRFGASVLHDRIGGGASFGLDQNTFLFDSQANNPFGASGDPASALFFDPRFQGFGNYPASGFFPDAPDVTAPSTPNLDADGNPIGTPVLGGFPSFFQFDRKTRNPYAIVLNFGIQRELPGNFLFEASYVGRMGRRLLAVGDAATVTNFKDPTSGQFLKDAFGALQLERENGVGLFSLTPQPWFENQMGGTPFCEDFSTAVFGLDLNCTQLVGGLFSTLVRKGDLSDTLSGIASLGPSFGGPPDTFLNYNVGLPSQTAANGYIGNYASSNYNALLLTLRKRISNGLQFDFNYTYSHSIDNVSDVVNGYVQYTAFSTGLVCELQDLRVCRASSDFDARHTISTNWIYDLPIGQGRRFMHDAPRWADAIVGGWSWSGIGTWRSGYPFSAGTGSFPTAFTLDSPALLIGARSDLKQGIHTDDGGNLQFFSDETKALAAIGFPQGGNVGSRNVFRGPGIWDIDMGVTKSFKMPWNEAHKLVFRWDSFNTFNHPSFSNPASVTLNNTSQFGIITSTASTPRVMQYALRYEF